MGMPPIVDALQSGLLIVSSQLAALYVASRDGSTIGLGTECSKADCREAVVLKQGVASDRQEAICLEDVDLEGLAQTPSKPVVASPSEKGDCISHVVYTSSGVSSSSFPLSVGSSLMC